ncbi:hypothetical protein PMG71_18270 [Roseofilum sp. BLCC_M154]|uniref:Uncharacterized protein n=1 Tax=Roseofilum acuticapitatum BLCC-M154 TaxID=3022444 RepID=A0ABT7AWY0_9CYAN|nr:hypothetical protein [Roseofilum acuticapitatum]MDJ1171380.1 hypothetical protein [Roseofilum acuticapitatum BLCC-M154]
MTLLLNHRRAFGGFLLFGHKKGERSPIAPFDSIAFIENFGFKTPSF